MKNPWVPRLVSEVVGESPLFVRSRIPFRGCRAS